MKECRIVVVEDVALELKGTLSIIDEIPEASVVGVAQSERDFWTVMAQIEMPDLILLDLGLGGSTTVGVDICRRVKTDYPSIKVLVFTGEITNECVWVDVLGAGADGIVLKTGELLTPHEIELVMCGRRNVFNQPLLEHIVAKFCQIIERERESSKSKIEYDIDKYDEILLRHLALGYTKDMISELRTMPFSTKSIEKRQADLVNRLMPIEQRNSTGGVNVTRLVVKAIELHIIDPFNLEPDE